MLKRKMKSDTEFVTTPLGVILFVGIVVAFVMFVQASMAKFSGDLAVSEKQIQVVDLAHLVKNCLCQGGESIPANFLESLASKKENLGEKCKIKSVNFGARIEYLEGPSKGTKYDFNYDEKKAGSAHKIFMTIIDGDKNYVSRLAVRLYE